MCGIVGYVGNKRAMPVLMGGLKALEYRGYDSAGVVLPTNDGLMVIKIAGKVNELERLVNVHAELDSFSGIGHTRWATHGKPTEVNAHPHVDCSGKIALVHNGIIENHEALRESLIGKGHYFKSETDTEVIPHLIEQFLSEGDNFLHAFTKTAKTIRGAFALSAMYADDPRTIYATRLSSPLVIGKGDGENFVASDASPFIGQTNKIIYLKENEVASVTADSIKIFDLEGREVNPLVEKLEGALEAIQKGSFSHFMLKEIHEQPGRIEDAMRGKLIVGENRVVLGGVEKIWDKILNARRLIIIGCGTSWHAGLAAEYMLEEMARIPVEVEYASEFRYRHPVLDDKDVLIAISQSGETADTLAALKEAKKSGVTTMGIVNVAGSSIAREVDAVLYMGAGAEIGVASTKAFTSQLTVLALLTFAIAKAKGKISQKISQEIIKELSLLPQKAAGAFRDLEKIKSIAGALKHSNNFLYLGRGANFPTALEGALKLKEVSYIHAEGYPAAEMKHGPIALIDSKMPVVVVVPQDAIYEKVMSNIQEVRARGGRIIAVANDDDKKIASFAEFVIRVPRTLGWLGPIINSIPLQLLAYYIALERGCNIDQPRNLAKSVTVE
ncbi:MAG: glutamine--fructose-6-phosphate transaminase (isomerizing) [Patescibacteria group bacterium]